MKKPLTVEALDRNRIRDLHGFRARINMSPPYQRQSDVWQTAKQQLFIDSLLNGFDIPKLYFHESHEKGYRYAVVDGKQRLNTIWRFIDDELSLSDDFELLEDDAMDLAGTKYSKLPPKLQSRLDDYPLPIQIVYADELQWVEELFSRLNEAVALNAPERRNAMGGPLPDFIRKLPSCPFFTDRLPFENNRYRHLDLATKFLYLEFNNGPAATKRRALDELVRNFKVRNATNEAAKLYDASVVVLRRLEDVFGESDYLLTSLGLVVVYYLMERNRVLSKISDAREALADFDELRKQVRLLMRAEPGKIRVQLDAELVEFERLSQSPNDSNAMTTRMSVLTKYLKAPSLIRKKQKELK